MKKISLLLALLLVGALLTGCASPSENAAYPEANPNTQRDPMSTQPTATRAPSAFSLPNNYNPASEEDGGGYLAGAVYDENGNTVYAGATPIPLDPIDMPTPTPRPPLTFSYGTVTADNIHLTFEAPAGWSLDTSAADTVVLTDPNTHDNYNASMSVKISSVPSGYKLADVRTEVRRILSELGQYNYAQWENSELASRTLLKKDGYYANYRGVYYDGTVVRGRVMVALLDNNQIITVHMSCPGWYNESYMNVVAHFRDTLKLAQ